VARFVRAERTLSLGDELANPCEHPMRFFDSLQRGELFSVNGGLDKADAARAFHKVDRGEKNKKPRPKPGDNQPRGVAILS